MSDLRASPHLVHVITKIKRIDVAQAHHRRVLVRGGERRGHVRRVVGRRRRVECDRRVRFVRDDT